jgi:hypothetical protein
MLKHTQEMQMVKYHSHLQGQGAWECNRVAAWTRTRCGTIIHKCNKTQSIISLLSIAYHYIIRSHCISHLTLSNQVLHFISGDNFKLSLLYQPLMDFLENWFLNSYICCLSFCDKISCKIHMLQFCVFGSVWVNFYVIQLYWLHTGIEWHGTLHACTYLYILCRWSMFIVEFIVHSSEWQLLHWAWP